MRSIPPSSSATRATTATAFATTWRSEASNPSSRRDLIVRRQSNTIGKSTSGATSSSGASIASSNSRASPPDTRKPPELTFQCYASQQRNSGSKPSTRPSLKARSRCHGPQDNSIGIDKSALPIGEARRYRDKAHLKFVASQPCLICGRRPSDPHHLRFAQKRALGRKVSDEFTVPLCRLHHRELHRSGDERAWWNRAGIDSVKIARKLWKKTRHLPASGIPAGTTAAGANAHDSQVAHAAEKGPASQGAAVESD